MQITKTSNWSRRDFNAECTCEHCGHVQERSGYDDNYYYQSVMPDMKCDSCGESSNSKSTDELKSVMVPKYPSYLTI